MNPLVVNFFAGPGCGKSSTCAGVFSQLKWAGVNCEMALEYAKDKVWEESFKTLHNQIYVFGKQHHRMMRLADHVECIVTDSPLLLATIYGRQNNMSQTFHSLVMEEFQKYRNLNYFLTRKKPYNPKGRMQTEDKARAIDGNIREMLSWLGVPYKEIEGCPDSITEIAKDALSMLRDVGPERREAHAD